MACQATNGGNERDLAPEPQAPATLEHFDEESEQRDDSPSGKKWVALVAALALALVLVGLDNTIVATAVPSITNEFKTIADVGWYSSAFRLSSCSFQFMFGKLYTIYSPKVVFTIALAIFELGSLISGVATSSKIFVVGRACAGLGTAGMVAGVFCIITLSLPLQRRSMYSGAFAAVEELACASAPLLGGVLTDRLSWRWCFYINLPLGIFTFVIVGLYFENPIRRDANLTLTLREKMAKLDILGTVIFWPCMVSLLLVFQWGGTVYGWTNARIIVLLLLFAILLCVFAWLQVRRGDLATLPLRIITKRSVLAGLLFSLCNNAALSVVDYYMPIYFQSVKEMSPTKSGVMVVPSVVGLMLSLLFSGTATSIVGYYAPFMVLTSVLTPIVAGLLTTVEVDAKLVTLICYQALLGFGAGIGFQGPQVAMQTILAPEDIPIGIAIIQFGQNVGPAVFVTYAQTIFTRRLTADLGKYAPSLDAKALSTMGLKDLKSHVGEENLEGALLGYDKAVTQTFYLPLALSCATMLGSLGMEWRSVKKKTS
ncbi:MAG: hypothetical protein Q9220_003900 [cf. Caloplaca sp. 1 TL-2023]